MEIKDYDRKETQKNKVQVRIVLPDAKVYHAHADAFKRLAEQTGGSMAVKMVCK